MPCRRACPKVCDRVAILRRGDLVHLQDMKALRQAQKIVACFHGEAPAPPPGLRLEIQSQTGNRLVVLCRSELPPVLAWLAAQAIADLRVEPLGLSEIYQRYHGNGT